MLIARDVVTRSIRYLSRPLIAALLAASLPLISGCTQDPNAVSANVAEELGFDSARCVANEYSYRCDVFAKGGARVLGDCEVGTRSDSDDVDSISGCRPVGNHFVQDRLWDDVERRLRTNQLHVTLTFPSRASGRPYEAVLASRDRVGGGLRFAIFTFTSRADAVRLESDRRSRTRYLFGGAFDLASALERRGIVVRHNKTVVWIRRPVQSEVKRRLMRAIETTAADGS